MTAAGEGCFTSPEGLHILLARKLQGFDIVSPEEVNVLEDAIRGARSYDLGQEMVGTDTRPRHSSVLVEGWAARSRTLEDGARQITAIHVPGDFVDLHSFLLHKMDHSVVALTPCRMAIVSHDKLKRITEDYPHLARLLWLNTLVDAGIHRNWIVGMGRLSSAGHMAQLICELYMRLAAVNLADHYEFELPLTQPAVADALGMSLVHVNRTLRELREKKLISWRARMLKILDWDGLASIAQFDPTYLCLMQEPR